MSHIRTTLKPISNERYWKITFVCKKKDVSKKLFKLCIMCQAKVCLIVYDDKSDQVESNIWPQDYTNI